MFRSLRRTAAAAVLALAAALLPSGAIAQPEKADAAYDVLVFSRTTGFRHDSIPAGIDALRSLGSANDFSVTATEDPAAFTPANLTGYEAVVFLNTTGDVLNDVQQNALQAHIDAGRGFVGVHAAADTEYGWGYYGDLVGARFKSHPAIQQARLLTEDRGHPATAHLGESWTRTDEWYNYQANPRSSVHVLQSLDESSYSGGEMGDHPITWCHAQGSGRSFYTGLGHTAESYADPAFRALLLGGLRYASGVAPANCSTSSSTTRTVEGEAYSSGSGVQIAGHAPASGGQTLGYIDNGDWAGYATVPTAGAARFSARVSSAGAGGAIDIRSGSATGPVLGSVTVPVTGGWETFTTVSTDVNAGTGPLYLTFRGGAGALFDVDTFTVAYGTTPRALASDVHLFYYPWYGSPAVLGSWRHWQQGGRTPPEDIGANLYPALGPYDSGDFTTAVARHMEWVKRSGAGVIVYSWWGRDSYEDRLVRGVLDAAAAQGVKVAWHLEPYANRTAASTVADINYLNTTYGSHPAFYRDAAHGNKNAFYVFESLRITDWSPLDQVTGNSIVLAQTTDTTKIAHFSGMYTYDGIAGATAPGWKQAGDYAKAHGLIWAPSVAPGYNDDRAVPGNTTPTLARDNGAAYDRQWSNALDPQIGGSPTWVSVTSFNEWHEGSVIEPADSTPPSGHGYETYNGAYGRTGTDAETAYLDRTALWVGRFTWVGG
ncbi:Glycoprotein endo-alpha-1,2-mannosidase [Streptomyces davaonensis JCM 4913]|uniref:Glycoprotein endo-alpha-1,2-mannosidase n=1 Tax=Streptomyces davaonensis (strain DSM 101723 / JCM 4913 / KCC S-0913 / 768) TaxID=1214101 RepID=K4QVU5_STRDJ|nr:ThuA domain-containing protein [Streptomyces davaonensis]CCK24935.1 Glycoprotein endo-alpha-1,2-mannosidase [Streptomyces davaonensis JCM 4913]